MSAEIPQPINNIIPEYVTIPMISYSRGGVLFPEIDSIIELERNFSDFLLDIPDDHIVNPAVIALDFVGIEYLNYKYACNGFTFAIENFRGRRRKSYRRQLFSIYINLSNHYTEHTSPWRSLQEIMEGDSRRPVVVGRQDGHHDYCLIGNAGKIAERKQCWEELLKEEGWVNGCEFVVDRFNMNKLDLPQTELLHRLSRDGLAMQGSYKGKSYFRKTVIV